MSKPKNPPSIQSKLDAELDEALEESFPASDPIAVHDPSRDARPAARTPGKKRKKKGIKTRASKDTRKVVTRKNPRRPKAKRRR